MTINLSHRDIACVPKKKDPIKSHSRLFWSHSHTEKILCKRWSITQKEGLSKIRYLQTILVTFKNQYSWLSWSLLASFYGIQLPRYLDHYVAEWSLGRMEKPAFLKFMYAGWVGKMQLTFVYYIGDKSSAPEDGSGLSSSLALYQKVDFEQVTWLL